MQGLAVMNKKSVPQAKRCGCINADNMRPVYYFIYNLKLLLSI